MKINCIYIVSIIMMACAFVEAQALTITRYAGYPMCSELQPPDGGESGQVAPDETNVLICETGDEEGLEACGFVGNTPVVTLRYDSILGHRADETTIYFVRPGDVVLSALGPGSVCWTEVIENRWEEFRVENTGMLFRLEYMTGGVVPYSLTFTPGVLFLMRDFQGEWIWREGPRILLSSFLLSPEGESTVTARIDPWAASPIRPFFEAVIRGVFAIETETGAWFVGPRGRQLLVKIRNQPAPDEPAYGMSESLPR